MIRFKKEAIEKRLEERKSQIILSSYHYIQKTIDKGAEGMDAYTLTRLCDDLKCLPTDIVEYI
jgi:DNA-binding Xre family transcriptional regulator